ncbi:MMPL family transporter, partial [Paenibacillus sepulcri]|nr:MMPL family transporter [Paenibacillus sepulcri]
SSFIMNRPRRSALLAFFLLGICILPAAGMKLAVPDAGSLPPDYKSRLAFDVYQAEFVSPSVSTVYIVDGEERQEQDNRNPIDAGPLTLALKTDPRVLRVDELQGEYPSLQVMLAGEPSSREVMSWLREWERRGAASASPFLLGGEAKYQQEVYDAVFDHIHQVLAFIFVSNFAVLFLAFRSVLIPLKTILMNFMSIGASFGILVWVFQGGFSGMGPGSIAIMIPVFIFGLAFGISMDYGVFLVSRIYEIHRQTGDNEYSVRWGLVATGRIITSAAAIMVAVTAPFAFGEVAGVRQLGVGIAAAVLVDATVIRLILVPSLMNWLGKWNWWAPRWLK